MRRCFKRDDVPPVSGVSCAGNLNTCFVGTQTCPDGQLNPVTECTCPGRPDNEWGCAPFSCDCLPPVNNQKQNPSNKGYWSLFTNREFMRQILATPALGGLLIFVFGAPTVITTSMRGSLATNYAVNRHKPLHRTRQHEYSLSREIWRRSNDTVLLLRRWCRMTDRTSTSQESLTSAKTKSQMKSWILSRVYSRA